MSSRAVRQFRLQHPSHHLLLSSLSCQAVERRSRPYPRLPLPSPSLGEEERGLEEGRRRRRGGKSVTWSSSLLQVRSITPSPSRELPSPSTTLSLSHPTSASPSISIFSSPFSFSYPSSPSSLHPCPPTAAPTPTNPLSWPTPCQTPSPNCKRWKPSPPSTSQPTTSSQGWRHIPILNLNPPAPTHKTSRTLSSEGSEKNT